MASLKIQLPNGFLDEEIRNGYLVSSEMKKAWAVMLDLLVELDRVCKKYHLTYYANGGTMLGAVRHKGFIPWDDDVDVMMFRNDYNKLMEIGLQEFKHPYFLQNKATDPTANDFFAKLRNSETSALFEAEKKTFLPYNKGIFIDIFPLDNVPNDEMERKKLFKLLESQRRRLFMFGRKIGIFSDTSKRLEHSIKYVLYLLLKYRRLSKIREYIDLCKEYDNLCSKCNAEQTEIITTYVYGPKEKLFKRVSDFNEVIELNFEFIKIPVCSGYDHYLKNEYGNYMEFVKGASMHGEIFFDTEKSYLEYEKHKVL